MKCLIIILVALLAGCATYRDVNSERLNALSQKYSQSDMILAWEIKPRGTDTEIEGVLKNVRYYSMDGVEVWVTVLDPEGKPGQTAADLIIPTSLKLDETAPFSLTLPVVVAPGTRLRFTYKYSGMEGGETGGGTGAWIQSFMVIVPPR